MLEIIDKSKCSGCHACANACPKKCISMIADNEGFLYPFIDSSLCISCGLCKKVCPIITPQKTDKAETDISAYAAQTKNEDVRKESSSGGIFTEIATCVLNQNGVVFGSSLDNNLNAVHIMVSNVDDLQSLRGSKYVQSTIGDTYKKAKEHLDKGIPVLYTGTPCQIGGLYSCLGKEYDNLITQDFICHGVPSPKVWQGYLDYHNKKYGSKVVKASFRNKTYGWKKYSMRCELENGKTYISPANKDPYIKSFLSNYCLRPSCYNCSFKNKVRQSDITLADFWGIQEIMPELNDDKGISLLIINSKKGQKIIDAIKNSITIKDAELDEAIKHNPSLIKSVALPTKRQSFMDSINKIGFIKTTNRFFSKGIVLALKKAVKKALKIFKH